MDKNVHTAHLKSNEYMQQEITECKQLVKELKAAIVKAEDEKNRSEAIIGAIGDGIIIQDTDFKIVYQNQIQKDLYGDRVGEHCYKAYENRDTICEGCPVELSFRDGEIHRAQRSPVIEGKILHVELTASPLRDSSGKIIAGIKVIRNITKSRRIEKALQESEERYRSLFENSPISIWEEDFSEVKKNIDSLKSKGVEDLKTYFEAHPEEVLKFAAMVKVLDVNRATLSLFKAIDKEVIRSGLSQIFTPHSYDTFREELIAMAEGKLMYESEDIVKTFTGELIPIYFKWSIAPGHEETYSKRFVSIVDITERKLADERLKLFSEAVENAPDGVQLVDLEGKIIYSNKAVEEIYGFSREEFEGKHVNEMNVEPEFAGNIIFPSIKETGRWAGELMVKHKDGRAFPVLLTASMVKTSKGEPIAMVGIIRDITEPKRIEEAIRSYAIKLEESSRIKELFTDIMHHDLLNPLCIAKGFNELLQEDETEPKKRAYLETIERNLQKAADLIDTATKFSKIESLESIEFEDLDLKAVIGEVIKDLAPMAVRGGVRIENDTIRDMPVRASRIIEEIFSNLISNAIKYAPAGKRIIVSGEDRGDRWKVMVKDFGEGIKDSDKKMIFERFRRMEKKGVKGTGLGLAIARKIVELHRGRIWVEDNPDCGAVFIVEIPKS